MALRRKAERLTSAFDEQHKWPWARTDLPSWSCGGRFPAPLHEIGAHRVLSISRLADCRLLSSTCFQCLPFRCFPCSVNVSGPSHAGVRGQYFSGTLQVLRCVVEERDRQVHALAPPILGRQEREVLGRDNHIRCSQAQRLEGRSVRRVYRPGYISRPEYVLIGYLLDPVGV